MCFVLLGVNAAVSHAAAAAQAGTPGGAHDASIRLIADALVAARLVSDIGLVDFLQLHTNIPRSTRVAPVTIDLAALDGRAQPRCGRTSSSSSSTACGATTCRRTTVR